MGDWQFDDSLSEVEHLEIWLRKTVTAVAPRPCLRFAEHRAVYVIGRNTDAVRFGAQEGRVVRQTGTATPTYHGPGQRTLYVVLQQEAAATVVESVIDALLTFNLRAIRRPGLRGLWVERLEKPPRADGSIALDHIAEITLRLRGPLCFGKISVNVEPDLAQFAPVIASWPLGEAVTSLVDLGFPVTMEDLDVALLTRFAPLLAQ